jgi:hypothetical protein
MMQLLTCIHLIKKYYMTKVIITIILILGLPRFVFSQKAYEAIYYSGKTENLIVNFTFGDGYIEACEIKTTDLNTKKTSLFLPDFDYEPDSMNMKFYHFSKSNKKFNDYFIIDGIKDVDEEIPAKFFATYYFRDKAYKLTLFKL